MPKKQEPLDSGKELIAALDQIEKEEDISKDVILQAVEASLLQACKSQFGNNENIKVTIDRVSGSIRVISEKTVVDENGELPEPPRTGAEDEEGGAESEPVRLNPAFTVTIDEARRTFPKAQIGDVLQFEVTPKNFGRIAAKNAKQVVVQMIREEERKVLYRQYLAREHEIVTGIVQRKQNNGISINLGKVDAVLTEQEQVPTEVFRPTERIKLFVVEVKNTNKGPRITVSRTHPDLVRKLFESEVSEIQDGVVEIKNIAREPGSRTKISVYSHDEYVDAVGACVGLDRARVDAVVTELRGEKIDIVVWSDDPTEYITNALAPARVISVDADPLERSARVLVADSQLSLAIGIGGQNARLAARLTGYKIDIKSESQMLEEFV